MHFQKMRKSSISPKKPVKRESSGASAVVVVPNKEAPFLQQVKSPGRSAEQLPGRNRLLDQLEKVLSFSDPYAVEICLSEVSQATDDECRRFVEDGGLGRIRQCMVRFASRGGVLAFACRSLAHVVTSYCADQKEFRSLCKSVLDSGFVSRLQTALQRVPNDEDLFSSACQVLEVLSETKQGALQCMEDDVLLQIRMGLEKHLLSRSAMSAVSGFLWTLSSTSKNRSKLFFYEFLKCLTDVMKKHGEDPMVCGKVCGAFATMGASSTKDDPDDLGETVECPLTTYLPWDIWSTLLPLFGCFVEVHIDSPAVLQRVLACVTVCAKDKVYVESLESRKDRDMLLTLLSTVWDAQMNNAMLMVECCHLLTSLTSSTILRQAMILENIPRKLLILLDRHKLDKVLVSEAVCLLSYFVGTHTDLTHLFRDEAHRLILLSTFENHPDGIQFFPAVLEILRLYALSSFHKEQHFPPDFLSLLRKLSHDNVPSVPFLYASVQFLVSYAEVSKECCIRIARADFVPLLYTLILSLRKEWFLVELCARCLLSLCQCDATQSHVSRLRMETLLQSLEEKQNAPFCTSSDEEFDNDGSVPIRQLSFVSKLLTALTTPSFSPLPPSFN
eukprot:ANDGO_02270.mRNA.1 hypothetical protein